MPLTETEKILLEKMLSGNIAALSRIITLAENRNKSGENILKEIDTKAGNSFILGVTGPPGSGKSTIVNDLIKQFRSAGCKVGIIAIDPSSQFSGGALLGDRIRMQEHYEDEDVYIRSVGARGNLGGISTSTYEIIKLLDVYGFDIIIIETVGVGQSELDIVKVADTVMVVLVPESGDTIQMMKAGIMEIADIFVVNKSDRSGAENLCSELRNISSMHKGQQNREIPVLLTNAVSGYGIDNLFTSIREHKSSQKWSGIFLEHRKSIRERQLEQLLQEKFTENLKQDLRDREIKRILKDVRENKLNIYDAADRILKRIFREL